MYLKCRHSGVYFLLFVISFPCRPGYYLAGQKRRDNVDDYGERLSSLERVTGQRNSNSGLTDDNKAPIKLSGIDHKYQEDTAQEEGMSLQDIPVVKLELGKSSSNQVSKEDNNSQNDKLAQYTISTAENTKEQDHEDKQLKTEENSKEQDHEDKTLKSEEISKEQHPDFNPLKSEEKDVNQGEKEKDNESKPDLTVEHESSTVKQDDITVTFDDGPSTKCTTDREVTIGNYTPQDSQSNDEGRSHDDSHGGDSGGAGDGGGGENKSSKGEDGHNDIDEEAEEKVSKVYKGPKLAKAPDHYIDDV